MPENIKWELASFALKIAPVILALLFAWIASKKPSAKKAFDAVREYINEALNVVNQTFVEPRKAGGTWDETAKKQARELFWQKFIEITTAKAEYWLEYLLGVFGEAQLKSLVIGNELHDEMQLIKK